MNYTSLAEQKKAVADEFKAAAAAKGQPISDADAMKDAEWNYAVNCWYRMQPNWRSRGSGWLD